MTIISQSCLNFFAQLILMASTLIWEEKQTLAYSSIYINCISFWCVWTKFLILVLQEFMEGNQQYHGLLCSTFQTINITFSELKITSSINDQSGLSKKKHLHWLKTFEGTSPLTPIKLMIYGAVLERRLCGHFPNTLGYVNFIPEVLTISLVYLTFFIPICSAFGSAALWLEAPVCAGAVSREDVRVWAWLWHSHLQALIGNFCSFRHIFSCLPSCWWKEEVNGWR